MSHIFENSIPFISGLLVSHFSAVTPLLNRFKYRVKKGEANNQSTQQDPRATILIFIVYFIHSSFFYTFVLLVVSSAHLPHVREKGLHLHFQMYFGVMTYLMQIQLIYHFKAFRFLVFEWFCQMDFGSLLVITLINL